MKGKCVFVLGSRAETLPFEIKEYDLYHFLYENINTYWRKWIKQYASSFPHYLLLLLFPRLTEWSVLGVARQLCTLQTGRIVSKTEAGIYCLSQIPKILHPVISQAIEIRKDNSVQCLLKHYTVKLSFKRLKQTIACVNYIITVFNETYMGALTPPRNPSIIPGKSTGNTC